MPEFTREDWLTETQIKNFFNRAAAKKLFHLTNEPSQAQTESVANLSNAIDHVVLTDQIQKGLEEGLTPNETCPIISEGLDLCALVENLKAKKSVQESKIGDIEQKKLKKALNSLGIDDFGGAKATKKKMAKMIQQYVDEKCGCSSI